MWGMSKTYTLDDLRELSLKFVEMLPRHHQKIADRYILKAEEKPTYPVQMGFLQWVGLEIEKEKPKESEDAEIRNSQG